MKLYKTYAVTPFPNYKNYLEMLRNFDYNALNVDESTIKTIYLNDYEHIITRKMNCSDIPVENGLYHVFNPENTDRNFYGYIKDGRIETVLFDERQKSNVDELIMQEYQKEKILSRGVFLYAVEHSEINEQLKNMSEEEAYSLWENISDEIYDEVDLESAFIDEDMSKEALVADCYQEI